MCPVSVQISPGSFRVPSLQERSSEDLLNGSKKGVEREKDCAEEEHRLMKSSSGRIFYLIKMSQKGMERLVRKTACLKI